MKNYSMNTVKIIVILAILSLAAVLLFTCDESDKRVDIEHFENGVILTLESDSVSDLIWGADSQRLFFGQDDWICTVNSDGDDFSQLYHGENPIISADNDEVFFHTIYTRKDLVDEDYQITAHLLAMNPDGDNLRDLGEFKNESTRPFIDASLSPEGKWIAVSTIENTHVAYIPEGETIQASRLKIWNMETGEEMIDLLMHYIRDMQWDLDGSRLAIAGSLQNDPDQEERGIWVIDIGSGEMINISSGLTIDGDPVSFHRNPIWNTDGSKILFSAYNYLAQEGLDDYTVWIAEADGSGCELMTTPEICRRQSGAYDWSPDGTRIVLVTCVLDSDSSTNTRQEIRIEDIEGTSNETLFSLSRNADSISRIQWSPDGSRIAFTIHHDSTTDIYLIDVQ
ncbi:MAG: hypothetical protein ACTSWQ_06240 [Candidatus Thorarchaeota archaeon]